MNILYDSVPGGGLEKNVRLFAPAPAKAGHQVSILYLDTMMRALTETVLKVEHLERSSGNEPDNFGNDRLNLVWSESPCRSQDDGCIRRKEAVRSNVAVSRQRAALEIGTRKRYRALVGCMLARNHAKNYIVRLGYGCNDERGSLFVGAQIGKGKGQHHHVAFYKSAHASSSSGVFHSRAKTRSEAIIVASASPCNRLWALRAARCLVSSFFTAT